MKDEFQESISLMQDRLFGWMDMIIANLPNLIVALLVFVLFYILSGILKRASRRIVTRMFSQEAVQNLAATVISFLVVSLGFLLALGILNLDTILKSLLAGAGVMGLAIGLALQGTLSNTFSGIYLAIKNELKIGDWVQSNGFEGEVKEISLRFTKILESDNNIVVIPNSNVLDSPFKNFGLTERIRCTVTCGVGYDTDLKLARDTAIDAIAEIYPPKNHEAIEFYYREFGDSSINFMLRFWVDATFAKTRLEVNSEAIMAIKAAFDEKGIEIPFPIRTVYMPKNS